MLNPISEMFRNVNKEKGMFFSSLISLMVVFTLLDVLLIFFYNLNDFKAKLDVSNQVIIYVKTMAEPELQDFQVKLNSTKGIKAIKYEPKERALEKLQNELGVELTDQENPLSDSFYLYVSKNANVEELKNTIKSYPEVQELDMRTTAIQNSLKFDKSLDNILLFGLAGIGIFAVILIFNLTSVGIKARKKDVGTLTHIGVSNNFIRLTYFLEGAFLIGLASMGGFLIFRKVYGFILQGINLLNSSAIPRASRGELIALFLMSFILGIFITAVVNFSSTRRYLKFYKR